MGRVKKTDNIEDMILAYRTCTDNKKKQMLHMYIVERTMQYVKKIASGISLQSGISIEDIIQVGSIGLIKAIEFFDPRRKTRFSTYASYFIRGEIKHYLRDKVSLIKAPREVQEFILKISSAIRQLKEKGITEPSEEQIAEFLKVPVNKVHEVMIIELYKTTVSLDQTIYSVEDEELTLVDKIPSGDYQEILTSYEDKIMLASAIKELPAELQKIIELSYYQDLNQREIAAIVNLSQMQVSRRLKKALHKLYEIIKEGK